MIEEHFTLRNGKIECLLAEHGAIAATWCDHINKALTDGADAVLLDAPSSLVVPIFPDATVFAQVYLKDPIIPNGPAPMEMRFSPEIGREKVIPLGFWNKGEGMFSIRAVVIDYLRSKWDPEEKPASTEPVKTKCPSRLHTFKASQDVVRMSYYPAWKYLCLWNLAMENACTICLDLVTAGGDTANNFGIDESVIDDQAFSGRFGNRRNP